MGWVSAADEKSRSSLLRKRWRVFGAAGELEERMRIECSFRTPANLRGEKITTSTQLRRAGIGATSWNDIRNKHE